MDALGYRPNWAGRALRRQRTGLIGALVSAPSNPWRESLIALAQAELARHSIDLVVFPAAPNGGGLERFFDLLDRRAVDACFTIHVDDEEASNRYAECPVPVVAFAEYGFPGVPKVRHGYAEAAAAVARTLADRGIRRFAVLNEAPNQKSSLDHVFADPVHDVLDSDARPPAHLDIIRIEYGISTDLSALDWKALSEATRLDPVVLMCSSDRLAIQVASECKRQGIDVGRTVGVIGRGDIAEAKSGPVPLSTLGVSDADYSEVFAALAEAAKSGRRIEEGWNFPWAFIERESTAGLQPGSVT